MQKTLHTISHTQKQIHIITHTQAHTHTHTHTHKQIHTLTHTHTHTHTLSLSLTPSLTCSHKHMLIVTESTLLMATMLHMPGLEKQCWGLLPVVGQQLSGCAPVLPSTEGWCAVLPSCSAQGVGAPV